MGAHINVEISKPHEDYQYTFGDINQIAQKIIKQLGKKDAERIAKILILELEKSSYVNS